MSRFPTLFVALSSVFILTACGGGGGGNGPADNVTPQDEEPREGTVLSYADVEPILQAKCTGCHNSGDTPLAPFSLHGEATASSFKSAINYAVDAQTMPPAGVPGLTADEQAQLLSWSGGTPYESVREQIRIALVQAAAWDVTPKNRDSNLEHRPSEVDCPRGTGWLVEEDELEIRTEFCNYAALTQQILLDLEAGAELELAMSHSALNFNAPSEAHVSISIAGGRVWETTIGIPSDSAIIKQNITLPFDVSRGDPIEVHLHNHGDNAYTIHSLDAVVWNDQELEFCPTFESTFEAIQATVFEQAGCANSLCHGEAAEGGLNLRTDVAYDNLVGVSSEASSLRLISPREPDKSFFYHKLSAKTFPGSYAVSGSPMPSAGSAISAGQLEAIRLWIEAGAPKTGSVGDTLGRGEDEIERLLGVCLPEADAVNTLPLPPPERDVGVQFAMPPHAVPAESETEWCFAVYEDFRDVIPPEYMSPDREYFYFQGDELREDPYTHHNVLMYSEVPTELIHDPAFGEWTCAGGDQEGETCEPTDLQSCGTGKCRSEMQPSVACIGYGPGRGPTASASSNIGSLVAQDGFYETTPTHGIFYWNSHAFNLTTEDANHHVWRNLFFADDRRFSADYITYSTHISAGAGTPPFERNHVCRDYQLAEGDGLVMLSSHTHKRGEYFSIGIKGGDLLYETYTYDEPLLQLFEPALVFNSPDPADRVLEYCATYNNGLNADGSPNIDTVTRASARPTQGGPCPAVACVTGNVGAPCEGVGDDATCDSSPGAGDGLCDACAITRGISSDDEMFVLLGAVLPNHDMQMHHHGSSPSVRISSPAEGASFAAGDTVELVFDLSNFALEPPEGHDENDHDHDGHGHDDANSDHGHVSAGHYHVYLDQDDDDADHLTAWTESVELHLPADIAPGTHEIRVSLRAPDHHAVGAEDSITIEVE